MTVQLRTQTATTIASGIEVESFGEVYLFQIMDPLPHQFEPATLAPGGETFSELSQQLRTTALEQSVAKIDRYVKKLEDYVALLEQNVTQLQEEMVELRSRVRTLQHQVALAEARIDKIAVQFHRLKWAVIGVSGFLVGNWIAEPLVGWLGWG